MKWLYLFLLIGTAQLANAQLYMTRSGFIGFYSKTPLEDIRAENKQVYAVIDAGKKNLAFSLLVKGFSFTKELMQEHFNENYIESDTYPKSSFVGAYIGDVDPSKPGKYPVQVKGQLTLHGVTKAIEVPGTIEVTAGKMIATSNFKLNANDFNIKIPSLVREKIAQQIDVKVSAECTATK